MRDFFIVDCSQPSISSDVVERANGTRENWSPAQNWRLDGVGGGDRIHLLAHFAHLPAPTPSSFTLTIASLVFIFLIVFIALFTEKPFSGVFNKVKFKFILSRALNHGEAQFERSYFVICCGWEY